MLCAQTAVTAAEMSDGSIEKMTEVAASEAACGFGTCGACGASHSPNTCPQLLPCLHTLCKVCLQPGAKGDVRGEVGLLLFSLLVLFFLM